MTTRFPTPLRWILVFYVAAVLCYAFAVPIFEAPDEVYHFAVADEIARSGALPVQTPGVYQEWKQEGSQPPLYYMVAAALIAPVDRSDYFDVTPYNPHTTMGYPTALGNKNRIIHDRLYPPPLSGTHLAVFIGRLWSALLGGVTVFAVYQAARVIVPERTSIHILAAGLTAFNPQFLFIAGSMNNDNLVAALNSLVIWQTMVMLRDGFQTRRSLLLAVLVALATLSKLSGLVMVVTVAGAGLLVAYRRRDVRGLFTLGLSMVLVWGVLAGWWYARNLTLYGELFGTNTMLEIFGRRAEALTIPALLQELTSLNISYWGILGWFNVLLPDPFYVVMTVVSVAGFIGLAIFIIRSPKQRIFIGVLGLALTLGFAAFISWTLQTAGTQGRLLFGYIAPLSIFMALGLSALRIRALWVIVPLAAVGLVVPFVTIVPTYSTPVPLSDTAAMDGTGGMIPLNREFRRATLVGYRVEGGRYMTGDVIWMTLYWQPTRRMNRDYSEYISLQTADGVEVGKLDSYPAMGRMRTSQWEAGKIYPDRQAVHITASVDAPSLLVARVGLYDISTGNRLPLANGDAGDAAFDVGVIVPDEPLSASAFTQVEDGPVYEDAVRLIGYTQSVEGDYEEVSLLWEVIAPLPQDYAVHFMARCGEDAAAQADARPALPSRWWQAGDRVITRHSVCPRAPEDALLQIPDDIMSLRWYPIDG